MTLPARAREPGQPAAPPPRSASAPCPGGRLWPQTPGARPRCWGPLWGIQQCPRCREPGSSWSRGKEGAGRCPGQRRAGVCGKPEQGPGGGGSLVLLPGHLQDKSRLGNKGPLPSPDPAVARELGATAGDGKRGWGGGGRAGGARPSQRQGSLQPPPEEEGGSGLGGGLAVNPSGPQDRQGDGRHTPCPGLRTSWCPACCGASGHSGRWA